MRKRKNKKNRKSDANGIFSVSGISEGLPVKINSKLFGEFPAKFLRPDLSKQPPNKTHKCSTRCLDTIITGEGESEEASLNNLLKKLGVFIREQRSHKRSGARKLDKYLGTGEHLQKRPVMSMGVTAG